MQKDLSMGQAFQNNFLNLPFQQQAQNLTERSHGVTYRLENQQNPMQVDNYLQQKSLNSQSSGVATLTDSQLSQSHQMLTPNGILDKAKFGPGSNNEGSKGSTLNKEEGSGSQDH